MHSRLQRLYSKKWVTSWIFSRNQVLVEGFTRQFGYGLKISNCFLEKFSFNSNKCPHSKLSNEFVEMNNQWSITLMHICTEVLKILICLFRLLKPWNSKIIKCILLLVYSLIQKDSKNMNFWKEFVFLFNKTYLHLQYIYSNDFAIILYHLYVVSISCKLCKILIHDWYSFFNTVDFIAICTFIHSI